MTDPFAPRPEGNPGQPAPGGYPPPQQVPGYLPVGPPVGPPPPGYRPMGPYSPIVGRPLVSDETTWGMLAHLSIFALGIIGPIILMVTKGNQSPYIRYHAVEALNFHLTLLIVVFVCILTFFLIVPLLLVFVAEIGAMILAVIAAMAANRGETYRYPMTWRMVH